jgi:hypothetical protein
MTFSYKLAKRLALNGVALGAALGAAACNQDLPSSSSVADTAPTFALTSTTCISSSSSWVNTAFTSQTGTFTAQYDVTPSVASVDGVTGLSSAAATAYTSLAAVVRFNTSGAIDARNGGAYTAAQTIAYAAGKAYHIRVVVNVANRTYSAYVTPAGGSELTIGTNFAFRSEQSGATSLANLGAMTSIGKLTLCNLVIGAGTPTATVASVAVTPSSATMASKGTLQLSAVAKDASGNALSGQSFTWTSSAPSVATVSSTGLVTDLADGGPVTITATAGGQSGSAVISVTPSSTPVCLSASSTWVNTAFTRQTGSFTAQYDVTPSAAGIDGLSGLSPSAATDYTSLAAIVRFNSSGTIDARNGGAYSAGQSIAYSAGKSYHIRLVVDVANRLYSAYVTPAGGTEQAIGLGYAFRSEQSGATSLADWAAMSGTGTMSLCNFSLSSGGTVSQPSVASVTVSPGSATISPLGTVQLSAVAKDASGNTLSGQSFTWTSSATAVAGVSSTGLVTGLVSGGPVTITATAGGKSGTAVISVSSSSGTSSVCAPTGNGVCRYVDPNGNDSNAGTSSAPFRTLQQAANVVNPGDVVIVRNGTYTGGDWVVTISRSGTSSAWIVFKAENKWGAVVDGRNNTSTGDIKLSGSYLRVEGFEVKGANRAGIEAYGSNSNIQVALNNVHDIGRYCTDTSGGLVGINAYVPNMIVEQNVVHDIGRWANGQNGCSTSTQYWQNHDHGVYQGAGDNLTIRNNLFYNFTAGWAIQAYDGSGGSVSNLQIVNNTFSGANPNKDGQIIIAMPVRGLVVTNNIFYQPRNASIWFDGVSSSGTVANNLTYGASIATGTTSGMSFLGNLSGDPLFVSNSNHDFRLQSGSMATDRALTLSLVQNDFLGVRRPLGAGPDIGAYESH